ncbi:hypothetical protein BGW80DRAFT_405988 [Lactifluus volemus]|nr:hypothetical protein BGW80DRAFT_405988 [Lactifluus volemus]
MFPQNRPLSSGHRTIRIQMHTRRLDVRAEHKIRLDRLTDEGIIKIAGPLADPTNSDKLNGSSLVVEAENVAAVCAVLEQDLYWTRNVWDKEKLDIRAITVSINAR